MWWNGLTAVDQNSQANIDTLITVVENIRLTEVNAWADASRQRERSDNAIDETAAAADSKPNKNAIHPEP